MWANTLTTAFSVELYLSCTCLSRSVSFVNQVCPTVRPCLSNAGRRESKKRALRLRMKELPHCAAYTLLPCSRLPHNVLQSPSSNWCVHTIMWQYIRAWLCSLIWHKVSTKANQRRYRDNIVIFYHDNIRILWYFTMILFEYCDILSRDNHDQIVLLSPSLLQSMPHTTTGWVSKWVIRLWSPSSEGGVDTWIQPITLQGFWEPLQQPLPSSSEFHDFHIRMALCSEV